MTTTQVTTVPAFKLEILKKRNILLSYAQTFYSNLKPGDVVDRRLLDLNFFMNIEYYTRATTQSNITDSTLPNLNLRHKIVASSTINGLYTPETRLHIRAQGPGRIQSLDSLQSTRTINAQADKEIPAIRESLIVPTKTNPTLGTTLETSNSVLLPVDPRPLGAITLDPKNPLSPRYFKLPPGPLPAKEAFVQFFPSNLSKAPTAPSTRARKAAVRTVVLNAKRLETLLPPLFKTENNLTYKQFLYSHGFTTEDDLYNFLNFVTQDYIHYSVDFQTALNLYLDSKTYPGFSAHIQLLPTTILDLHTTKDLLKIAAARPKVFVDYQSLVNNYKAVSATSQVKHLLFNADFANLDPNTKAVYSFYTASKLKAFLVTAKTPQHEDTVKNYIYIDSNKTYSAKTGNIIKNICKATLTLNELQQPLPFTVVVNRDLASISDTDKLSVVQKLTK